MGWREGKKGHVKKQIDKCERNTRRQQGGKRGLCREGGMVAGQRQRKAPSFPISATLIHRGKPAVGHHLRFV